MNPEVSRQVAEALFRQLSGFRGYPVKGPGETYFIDAFQLACVSVDHARAVIATFDEVMPTIKEIRETALNLKPKFAPPYLSVREQWERDYGPPRPFPVDIKNPVGERRVDELWRKLREKFPDCAHSRKPWPSWIVLAKAARELGYEDFARAWENSYAK